MKVILSQDVDNLGKTGDVVKVKDGFARNFLMPQKKAYLATEQNLKKIEHEKAKREAVAKEVRNKAQAIADKFAGVSVTVNAEVNDIDKLYGAITEAEVAAALKEEGHEVDKKDIIFEEPIEELGIFEVGIKVHPEVIAKIRVWITKK
ncbi:MAG: 50S ribosomal protein L9 [Candidatus Aceula meridiana]|nr:50S ribosomal protein L9 [Candidatus Aceula meridiana]